MTELKFSKRDVEGLAGKLDALKDKLSSKEQELLLLIFAAAAERVSQADGEGSAETAGGQDLTELRDQLVSSFLPDCAESDDYNFLIHSWRITPHPSGP